MLGGGRVEAIGCGTPGPKQSLRNPYHTQYPTVSSDRIVHMHTQDHNIFVPQTGKGE
jgi:hypothetical protein